MRYLSSYLFLFVSLFFLVGCDSEKQGFNLEKKYYLKDCIVKINFNWDQSLDYPDKITITRKIGEQIKLAIVANEFPFFSGHTTRESNYYVVYFADQCENRKELTEKLVLKYFVPNIENFPAYVIKDTDVEPGFDGAMPSGFWLDDTSNE